MKHFKILIAIVLTTTHWTNIYSQSDSLYVRENHIRQLLELTGSTKIAIQTANQMIESYKEVFQNVPEEFWDELKGEIKPEKLREMIVPIYINYFNDEDILELIDFYNSPLGQKLINALPLIAKDSYEVGSIWGKEIGNKIIESLKIKGYYKDE